MQLRQLMQKIKYLLFKKHIETGRQFVKFSLIGISNSVISYCVYLILLFFNFYYILALIISNIISIINSYLWNRFWAFESKKIWHQEIFKFVFVYVVSFVVNLLLLVLLVEVAKIDPKLAQLLAAVFLVFLTFSGQKFWTFGR